MTDKPLPSLQLGSLVWHGVNLVYPTTFQGVGGRSAEQVLAAAIDRLASTGVTVVRVPEPWLNLYDVQGRGELTASQVLDLASQLAP